MLKGNCSTNNSTINPYFFYYTRPLCSSLNQPLHKSCFSSLPPFVQANLLLIGCLSYMQARRWGFCAYSQNCVLQMTILGIFLSMTSCRSKGVKKKLSETEHLEQSEA